MKKIAVLAITSAVLLSTTGCGSTPSQPTTTAQQKSSSFVSNVYVVNSDLATPVTVPGGVTIGREPYSSTDPSLYVPYISYKGNQVWNYGKQCGMPVDSNWIASISQTKEGNTYLLYQEQVGAGGSVHLIGVHQDGTVFVSEQWNGYRVDSKFIDPTKLEISLERQNINFDSQTQPLAALASGIYDVKNINLEANGALEIFDSQRIDQQEVNNSQSKNATSQPNQSQSTENSNQ